VNPDAIVTAIKDVFWRTPARSLSPAGGPGRGRPEGPMCSGVDCKGFHSVALRPAAPNMNFDFACAS